MPATTYDRFDGGLDRRKGKGTSDANRLRDLKNAFVTTGWQIRKRPGTSLFYTLETGTKGMVAGSGKLNTFYPSGGAVSHANSLFRSHRVAHPTDDLRTLTAIHRAEVFDGALYLSAQYDNGDTFHHYLASDTAWAGSTVYATGDFVSPTTANGYRYEATTGGTSAATEPAFPQVVGSTVADGTVTWTCRSKAVADVNCPNNKSLVKIASKIFSPSPTDETVPYSATNAPTDWTTASDAGFLPTGIQAEGDPQPSGVGRYKKQLTVTHRDGIQIWTVDPDPSKNAIADVLDLGTKFDRSLGNVSGDLYLLTDFGFRSVSTLQLTGNLQDLDVGSPADELVLTDLALTTDPIALFYNGGGQYWCRMYGGVVWVFTFSRISKVFAWSRYIFPYTIDDMAELQNVLYLRSGDKIYKVDDSVRTDDGVTYEVIAEMAYQSQKKPGQIKQYLGCDVVMEGSAYVSFKVDPDDETDVTPEMLLEGDTRKNGMNPVGVMATEIAPRFRNLDSNDWGLNLVTLYYASEAGPM